MVVGGIGEFLHSPVHLLLRPKFIQVGAFVLQGVEVPLHWRIVIRVSGFAHTLGHMDRPAEVYKCLGCILAPLIAVQNQAALRQMLGIQCFLQGTDCQVTGDVPVCYACNYTPVIEVYDGTVVTYIPVFQEQVCEIPCTISGSACLP